VYTTSCRFLIQHRKSLLNNDNPGQFTTITSSAITRSNERTNDPSTSSNVLVSSINLLKGNDATIFRAFINNSH